MCFFFFLKKKKEKKKKNEDIYRLLIRKFADCVFVLINSILFNLLCVWIYFFSLQFIYGYMGQQYQPPFSSSHFMVLWEGGVGWGGGSTGCLEVLHRHTRHIPKLFLDVFDCHN